jgi:hypothetical protein
MFLFQIKSVQSSSQLKSGDEKTAYFTSTLKSYSADMRSNGEKERFVRVEQIDDKTAREIGAKIRAQGAVPGIEFSDIKVEKGKISFIMSLTDGTKSSTLFFQPAQVLAKNGEVWYPRADYSILYGPEKNAMPGKTENEWTSSLQNAIINKIPQESTVSLKGDVSVSFNTPIAQGNVATNSEIIAATKTTVRDAIIKFGEKLGYGDDIKSAEDLLNNKSFYNVFITSLRNGSFSLEGSASTEYLGNLQDYDKQMKNARDRCENIIDALCSMIGKDEVNEIRQRLTEQIKPKIVLLLEMKKEELNSIINGKFSQDLKNFAKDYLANYEGANQQIQQNRNNVFGSIHGKSKDAETSGKYKPIWARLSKYITVTDGDYKITGAVGNLNTEISNANRKKYGFDSDFAANDSRKVSFIYNTPVSMNIKLKDTPYEIAVQPGQEVSIPISLIFKVNDKEAPVDATLKCRVYRELVDEKGVTKYEVLKEVGVSSTDGKISFATDELSPAAGQSECRDYYVVLYAEQSSPKITTDFVGMKVTTEATGPDVVVETIKIPAPNMPKIAMPQPKDEYEKVFLPAETTLEVTKSIVNAYGREPIVFLKKLLDEGGAIKQFYNSSNPADANTLYGKILASGKEAAWTNSIKDGNLQGFFQLLVNKPDEAMSQVIEGSPLYNMSILFQPETSSTDTQRADISRVVESYNVSAGVRVATLWDKAKTNPIGMISLMGTFNNQTNQIIVEPFNPALKKFTTQDLINRYGGGAVFYHIPSKTYYQLGMQFQNTKTSLRSESESLTLGEKKTTYVTGGFGKFFDLTNKLILDTHASGFYPLGKDKDVYGGLIGFEMKYDGKTFKPFTRADFEYYPSSIEPYKGTFGVGSEINLFKDQILLKAEAGLESNKIGKNNFMPYGVIGVTYRLPWGHIKADYTKARTDW